MRFAVLGPLEVSGEDGPIPLGGPKQRIVLAHLVLGASQVVSAEQLIDALWGEDLPEDPKSALRVYVSRIRSSLGLDAIEAHAPGYLLRADRDEVDALRFEDLLGEARSNGHEPRATDRILGEALALWRGPAFADLASEPSLAGQIARLEELRLQAIEEKFSAELDLGHHSRVVAELETLTRTHPLRERLWGELILALYRSERQGEALAAFERARTILAEDLGIDPSRELRLLHERILRQDADLDLQGEPLRGYRLLEQLGEGAFGIVYRAIQPKVHRDVAVKAIHPHLANDPEFIRRFEAEAQFIARLEHPHVVPLYDYWREPGGAYLVMRFLRGGNLAEALDDGAFEPERAARMLDQVGGALASAHRQGVVHRDVKPSNILLDEEGNAYLADFGIAKDIAVSDRTEPRAVKGSLLYLAPEQIRGETISPRTDVYALGVVLYEVLVGEHPFADVPDMAIFERQLRDPLPPARRLRRNLPPSVDDVIATATAKDPKHRFRDALSFADAFRNALPTPDLAGAATAPPLEARNPYKGLRPFGEADTDDFYGREAFVERLLKRWRSSGPHGRFLAVVGPSGSGKSSAVRAGLVPALRRGGIEGSEGWFITDLVPGRHPMEQVEAALLRVAAEPPPGLLEILESGPRGLLQAVDRVIPGEAELILVVDQFEEVFTLTEDEAERSLLLESLRVASADPTSRVRIVLTLRADFYDRPLIYPRFGELLGASTEVVTPLAPDELERAIVRPASSVGMNVEPALVAQVASDVAEQPGALPLVQYALTELFDRRQEGRLTLETYREIGGVGGALAASAEHLFETRQLGDRDAVRDLFLRLVTLGEGTPDTRRRVRLSELASIEADPRAMESALDAYGRHRLLTFDRDPGTREPTVEVAHEALLGAWDRLRRWIDEARDDIRIRNTLAATAADWEASGGDESFLLRGARLERVASWAETTTVSPSTGEAMYLRESVERRDQERAAETARQERERALERRSIRRLRGLVALGLAAALVATTLTVLAVEQRGRAEDEARISRARELAVTAIDQLDVDNQRGLLLAIEAVEMTHAVDGTVLREAQEALHHAVRASRLELSLPGLGGRIDWSPTGVYASTPTYGTEGPRVGVIDIRDDQTGEVVRSFPGHEGALTGVAFSPDGSELATTGADGALKVWDPTTGDLLTSVSERGRASGPSFSGDGSLVAASWPRAQDDATFVRVLDRSSGRVLTFNPADADGEYPALSPDGTKIAVATDSEPGIMKVIDLETGDSATLEGEAELGIQGIAWSPDGRYVAGGQFGSSVKVWEVETGSMRFSLAGHTDSALWVDWSHDSTRLVTGGADATTRVWEIAEDGARELMTLAAQDGPISGVAFSPDGSRVMTASETGVVKVWDIRPTGDAEWAILPDISGDVVWPEGGLVASEVDGSLALWGPDTGEQDMAPIPSKGPLDRTVNNALSPDGTTNAIFHSDALWYATGSTGTVRVVDLATGEELFALGDVLIGERIGVVDWSPDGEYLAAASRRSRSVTVYDRSGNELGVLPDVGSDVLYIEFSPDGALIATLRGKPWYGSADGVQHDSRPLWIWDWRRGEVVGEIPVGRFAQEIAFDPTGTRIVTDLLEIRDVESGRVLVRLSSIPTDAESLAFSPDGSRLAVGSVDGSVRLFDAESGEEVLLLRGHRGTVERMVFSPDGSMLASMSGDDEMVRVWALDIDDLLEIARREVTRSLTDAECRQFLHVDVCPPEG